jgi:hypothetical protein
MFRPQEEKLEEISGNGGKIAKEKTKTYTEDIEEEFRGGFSDEEDQQFIPSLHPHSQNNYKNVGNNKDRRTEGAHNTDRGLTRKFSSAGTHPASKPDLSDSLQKLSGAPQVSFLNKQNNKQSKYEHQEEEYSSPSPTVRWVTASQREEDGDTLFGMVANLAKALGASPVSERTRELVEDTLIPSIRRFTPDEIAKERMSSAFTTVVESPLSTSKQKPSTFDQPPVLIYSFASLEKRNRWLLFCL